jgi:hypothetical protein
MDNLLAKLARALDDSGIEPVPHGWHTIAELAREAGKSIPRTSEVIRRAIAAGLVEVRTFRIRSGSKVYPVPHYREVQCEKPTARRRS